MQRSTMLCARPCEPVASTSRGFATSAPTQLRVRRKRVPYVDLRKPLPRATEPIVRPQNAKVFNVADYLPTSLQTPPMNNRRSVPTRLALRQWLQGEAKKWKHPEGMGPFWIGDTPFPLNPSFMPPKPLSELVRQQIFDAYKQQIATLPAVDPDDARWSRLPTANPIEPPSHTVVIRALALKHGVTMDRVRAVVRLKALESRFVASTGYQLQTDYATKMNRLLGVDSSARGQRAKQLVDVAATDGERVDRGAAIEFVDVESGEQPINHRLLQPASLAASTRSRRPPQALPKREKRIDRVALGKRDLVFADMADTTRGRAWERSNLNKTSQSAHAARAAELTKLDALGRLPRGAYRDPADAEAIAEARGEATV